MTSCDTKLLGYPYIFGEKYLMSVTEGIGQTPCSLEHYLVISIITSRHNYVFALIIVIQLFSS